VYLNCNPNPGLSPEASTIVALSAATGEVQWQTPISPNRHSADWPMTVSAGQVLMLHTAGRGDQAQDQVVALDRQTGRRLWTVALFGKRDSFFRTRLATSRDRLLVTDNVPQWQLWLLQLNRGWYWNRAIVAD
jgi:outer membrane protein assembly factor BamB